MLRETTSRTVPSRDGRSWWVTGNSKFAVPAPFDVSNSSRASLCVTLPNVIASTRPTRCRRRRPRPLRLLAQRGYWRQTCRKSPFVDKKGDHRFHHANRCRIWPAIEQRQFGHRGRRRLNRQHHLASTGRCPEDFHASLNDQKRCRRMALLPAPAPESRLR